MDLLKRNSAGLFGKKEDNADHLQNSDFIQFCKLQFYAKQEIVIGKVSWLSRTYKANMVSRM